MLTLNYVLCKKFLKIVQNVLCIMYVFQIYQQEIAGETDEEIEKYKCKLIEEMSLTASQLDGIEAFKTRSPVEPIESVKEEIEEEEENNQVRSLNVPISCPRRNFHIYSYGFFLNCLNKSINGTYVKAIHIIIGNEYIVSYKLS